MLKCSSNVVSVILGTIDPDLSLVIIVLQQVRAGRFGANDRIGSRNLAFPRIRSLARRTSLVRRVKAREAARLQGRVIETASRPLYVAKTSSESQCCTFKDLQSPMNLRSRLLQTKDSCLN